MATIAHFEIPADNLERAERFYSSLFDWKFENAGGDYHMITTRSLKKGGCSVPGGLYQRQEAQMPIMDYIGVNSVSDYLTKVEKLGGKILKPKTAATGYGYYAIVQDTENNQFGLWEENLSAA